MQPTLLIRRPPRSKRIARVKALVVEIETGPAVKLLRAGLRKNLNPAPARIFVLSRVRVLVDANFTDRFLGRDAAVRKSVYRHLRCVFSLSWSGHRLQR